MTQRGPEHEPIVSETLQGSGERPDQTAQRDEHASGGGEQGAGSVGADPRTAPLREGEQSLKHHGDALKTGTGNRHGVHDPNRRPNQAD